MRLLRDVLFFGVSGVFGFLVDSAGLYALKDELGLFFARAISFVAAVFVTWLFNRSITFTGRSSGLQKRNEFVAYLLLMLAGGSVNYGIYVWLVLSYEIVAQTPIIGVAAGSLAGMLVNLSTSRWLLFRRTTAGQLHVR